MNLRSLSRSGFLKETPQGAQSEGSGGLGVASPPKIFGGR